MATSSWTERSDLTDGWTEKTAPSFSWTAAGDLTDGWAEMTGLGTPAPVGVTFGGEAVTIGGEDVTW